MIRGTIADSLWELLTVNVGTKIISVIIAIVLWVVVLGSRNVEVTKEVPLEVITPSELVASNDIPDKVAFKLSGPKAFLRAVLDRREDPIRVNLTGAKPGLVTYRFFSDNIRVPIGVKIQGINPPAVVIKLEQIKHKEIPVRLEIQGTPPEGYKLTSVKAVPDRIRIKGAESKVDAVAELETTPIDVSDLKQSVEKAAPFDLSRYGVLIDGSLPIAKLEIQPVAANYRIKNVDIRVTSTYKVRLDEKSVTVLVRAEGEDLKSLDRSKVFATIDLSGKAKGKYAMPVKITLPPNVNLVKVLPDKVTVTLY
jgi:YbbR domain-containing protein